ncbi:MAG: hypothetical protein OXI63_20080, partial [Candidatus Poribacteria bacterium]|nr:hypothetical protein [Candidatus Poribacteria bacterium]
QTPLQIRDLLHEITDRELPILIAHAERKPSETVTWIHRIRGSSALPALASITHRVTTDHRGLSYAKNTKNRASPLDPTRWQLNLQTGHLQHTQKSDTPATDKALQALRNLPHPATTAEGQNARPDTPPTPLLIQTLRDNQQIEEIPNHRGRHPGYKPAPRRPGNAPNLRPPRRPPTPLPAIQRRQKAAAEGCAVWTDHTGRKRPPPGTSLRTLQGGDTATYPGPTDQTRSMFPLLSASERACM